MLVQRGLLRSSGEVLRENAFNVTKAFVVSSEPILRLWGEILSQALTAAGHYATTLAIPDGETSKRLSTVEKAALQMVAAGADRHSVVFALGGGVVGDVAGLLASIFMRGIPVVQVPTTLVAQVDSAIGGKTGVNLTRGKNLIGTFHQPSAVLVDPNVLDTLPEREYRSGLFEAMKYGVIRNAEIFTLMESHRDAIVRRDGELLERLITDCIQVKADVVSADERESGERRILNFGHTIGHTLEAATKYRHFLHGEAVGWGMIAAAIVGRGMGVTDQATANRIIDLVRSYGELPKVNISGARVLQLLQSDKKTIGGVPQFVLARTIGQVEIVSNLKPKAVQRAIEEIVRMSRP